MVTDAMNARPKAVRNRFRAVTTALWRDRDYPVPGDLEGLLGVAANPKSDAVPCNPIRAPSPFQPTPPSHQAVDGLRPGC